LKLTLYNSFYVSHTQYFFFYLFLNAVLLKVSAENFSGAKETPRPRNSTNKPPFFLSVAG